MAGSRLRAGVGRVSITPPLTAPHASWGAQVHVLPDGVETDLWATALVVDDGARRVVLIDLDLVVITRAECDAIQAAAGAAAGVPAKEVRVSVTHNHAGPPPGAWNWTNQGREALERYYALLPELATGAVRLATAALRPARLAVGAGESRLAVNRRELAPDGRNATGVNPDGPIDPAVLVVRIDGADETPLAAIVGYTMHPTTLGPTNRLVSADWPGHLKRMVERVTGATCLFVQGAAGDVGPGPDGFTDDVRVVWRLGAALGCEAGRVYHELRVPPVRHRHERIWESGAPLGKWIAEPEVEPEPVLRVATRQIALPLGQQPLLPEIEARLAEAQTNLDTLVAGQAPADEIAAATFVVKRANMARSRARMYGGQTEFPVELHLLQLGPVVLAGVEGEPFVEIGLEIKRRSPFPWTWFGGYTGGWAGYVPTAAAYPIGGYEVDTSPFAPAAAQTLVETTVAALHDLASAG